MKIINKFNTIFQQNGVQLYLRPYEIIVTSPNSGFLEFCTNTISLDGLKKKSQSKSLYHFYKKTFGDDFEEA